MDVVLAAFDDWQRRRRLAESTIERRRSHLRQWGAWLGDPARVLTATWQDLEAFLTSLGHLAPQTVYDRLSHLHQFYRWALRHEHVVSDPTVMVDRPKAPSRLPRPIRDQDLATVLDGAPPTARAWVALGAYCGLRCAEIAHMSAEDLDGDMLFIVGKGGRERYVPVHAVALEAMAALGLPDRGRLWLQPNGRPYPPSQVSRLIGELFADLGVNATAHQLRHWCGTNMLRLCGDVTVVQQMLGHSDPKTTMIYAQVQVESVRLAAVRLPRVA